MATRAIPVGKIDGMRFGELIVTAMSEAGMKKEECINWLYYCENSELKQIVDDLLSSREERK